MGILEAGHARLMALFKATAAEPRALFFYQAIDLPGIGYVPGVWDHRGSENVYLGHVEFKEMSVLDIGPANGFWSFEMERRGAEVTAIELGPRDEWDIVPHEGPAGAVSMKGSVKIVQKDFWTCHAANKSKVKVKHGSVYRVPKIVKKSDVALMGNILQHLRDPFMGIERVASVVKKRMIVSESIWIDDPAFLDTARMQLIPRSHTSQVNHSWYQVSPVFVMEILKILGFEKQRCYLHEQKFTGSAVDPNPRMVPHFTVVADR